MQLHLFEASFKRCVGCRHTKPLDAFNRRSSAPDGRQAYCRECNARWHAENRERHNQSIHRRNQQVREAMRRQMVEYLSDKQCVDCRETDLRVLEFDHLRDKTTTVSQLMANGNWPRVLEEIEKCEVVCANCHRKRTHERAQTYRARMRHDRPTLE